MKITTQSGFTCELPENAADNMEIVDALAEMQSDRDMLAVSRVLRLLLGDANRKALYDHLRVDGRVPIEAVSAEISDIFAALGQAGKN